MKQFDPIRYWSVSRNRNTGKIYAKIYARSKKVVNTSSLYLLKFFK